MHNKEISEEYLNAFVDNQLDPAEKTQAFDIIRQDEKLKERVCELRGMKEIIKQAYGQPPAYRQAPVNPLRHYSKYIQPLAACLLLLAGGATGWFTHAWSTGGNHQEVVTTMLQNVPYDTANAETRKVIVHLGSGNTAKLKATLDETEGLLETYKRSNLKIQVEVITNKQGANLLRADVSAYKQRIGLMQAKYPNLNFMVCGQTISKLRSNGESVQLIPHTGIATSAAEQINKRLLQGWGYVRI